jgi:hypothetical protein
MAQETPRTPSLDLAGPVLGLLMVILFMFLPIGLVGSAYSPEEAAALTAGAGSATAALSAIFRASARTILRSSLLLALRATTRTFSRRIARAALRSVLGALLPTLGGRVAGEVSVRKQSGPAALGLGYVTLALSFLGVAMVGGTALTDMSPGALAGLSALAGLPLLVHSLLMWAVARATGVQVTFHTTLDGLLLQLYFTGSGSFMPLCSDAELDPNAPVRSRAICAGSVLGGLLLSFYVLELLAGALNAPLLSMLSGIFVLYAFVFAFPLQPLDGKDLWDYSPWAWLAVFGLVLWSFTTHVPDVLYDIL